MSSLSIFKIEIPKRNSLCAQGQEPFTSDMEFYSVLRDGVEEGVYIREDYCLKCWEKLSAENTLENIRSTWKSKVPVKKEVSELPKERDARAMYLLKEALLRQEPDDIAEAFILAMYLARKRIIYFRRDLVLADGQNASIYEVSQTEEMLCIPKMALSVLQIEKVQRALAVKFKN